LNGSTGSGLSHIKALKTALIENTTNDYVIIMEDDFQWNFDGGKQIRNILFHATNINIDWNVILLSCNGSTIKYHKYLKKINQCQTTSGYIIKIKYIPQLLKIWETDMNYRLKYNMQQNHLHNHKTCIDQSWKKLQHDKWFTTNPIIGSQIQSFSDIENKVVDYKI